MTHSTCFPGSGGVKKVDTAPKAELVHSQPGASQAHMGVGSPVFNGVGKVIPSMNQQQGSTLRFFE